MIKKVKLVIFIILAVIFFGGKVEAKSYSIENMDIQASIEEDGSVYIEQEMIYKFNGEYNGIYINVPYNLKDPEYQTAVKDRKISDNFYNGSSVNVQEVLVDGKSYKRQNGNVVNGTEGVYTQNLMNGVSQIKVYSPSTNVNKNFKVIYKIGNLCVKHNDVGELYYNFIGGAWEVTLKKVNIDIYLKNNKDKINIWGHGPYNGQSKIIDNTHANFQVSNVKPGQYVAARIIFDKENISESTKNSNINAKDLIFSDEGKLVENEEEKNKFTIKILIFAGCLLIYWIILLLIFEKDKKEKVISVEEDEMFKKYNPMIAGCIQGSRNILARDILAVILNLINKKIINLDIKNNAGKESYYYFITQTTGKEEQMDEIEKYVYEWVFCNSNSINLQDRLNTMPKEEEASKKFKELNTLVEKKLMEIKANEVKVPKSIRIFNVFLFILSLILLGKHILFNGFNVYDMSSIDEILMIFGIHLLFLIILIIPFMMAILYVPINLAILIKQKVSNRVQRITGQKVVSTAVTIAVFFGIIILITAYFSPIRYIVADEVLICIATVIMLTDNLMLKNNPTMIKDYSRLNIIKDKIEKYSMMEDRDIEQVVLWERYLCYAVSFGIAKKVIKRIKEFNLDENISTLINDSMFTNYIYSDYYYFYRYAGVERRFLKTYSKATEKAFDILGTISASGNGSGGGFSGGGGFSRRWRKPEEVAEPSKEHKKESKYVKIKRNNERICYGRKQSRGFKRNRYRI